MGLGVCLLIPSKANNELKKAKKDKAPAPTFYCHAYPTAVQSYWWAGESEQGCSLPAWARLPPNEKLEHNDVTPTVGS